MTLLALNVSHDMPTGCHVTFARFAFFNIDDIVKEVCFAMLASEVLGPTSEPTKAKNCCL